ncbi:MAG TPA: SurA N-terminal domain-containing protein [Thermoanaerobaculia bacterium]|nr:SurA N-terminal domain-containing protein [Thermoanaerobaculia bacterium]
MLKAFRDNLKYLSWILWVVIGLFVLLVFVDFGTLAGGQGSGGAAPAVRVGDREVTMEEFERQYRQLEGFYRQMQGDQFTPEMARQMGLPAQALSQVVGQEILLAEAERLGIAVTDAELRERILEESVFRDPQGRFVGREEYERILRQNRLSVSAFEADMRQQILLEKLNNMLSAGIYVSDAEVERAYRDQVERAKIRYVQLPRARFAQAQVTPAELQSYFQANKEQYKLPEQREGGYLLVEPDKLRDQANLTDQQVREYYDANQAEFTRPEQVQARHILLRTPDPAAEGAVRARLEEVKKRIQGGADFGAVAAEVSEEPGAKERKGDLGWFGSGQMVPEFEQAAFGARQGDVVGPVKTSFGFHLIQVTGRRPPGVTPFEEAREQIRARLSFTRAQELAEAKAKELAASIAKNPPKSAEDLAKLAQGNPGVSTGTAGKFGAQEPIPNFGYAPALTTAAFAIEKEGGVSEAVQVPPRGWAVFWLKDIHEPRVPELTDVEPRVRAALTAQKQQELAMQRLRQVVTPGKTLDQIAAELGLTVAESQEFGAGGAIPGIGYNPELTEAAMTLPTGKLGGPVADAQGAIVFQVTERKAWDPIQFASAREETRASVQNQKLGQLLNALVAERRREVGVQYDPRLLETFGITPEQVDPSRS